MKLELTAIKTNSGIWVFDHEHNQTIAEPLCNGTEEVLDEYFDYDMNREPKEGDRLEIVVDTEVFDEYDTILQLQSANEHGSTYLDTELYLNVWLCPWLQSYFGNVPESLYVKVDAVNPARVAFQKVLRMGVNPFSKYLKKGS